MFFEKWWPRFPVLGLSQTSDEFEVLVEDDESSLHITEDTWKQKCGGLLTRNPWVKLWDLVLTSFQTSFWYSLKNPGKAENHKFAAERERSFKSHSLCLCQEKTSNWSQLGEPNKQLCGSCSTKYALKTMHHRSANHSPIFWVPRFINVPYLVPILILFLSKKCFQP